MYLVPSLNISFDRNEKIAKEDDSINLISQLIISEVIRQNKEKGLTADKVADNAHASQLIAVESKSAHDTIFGGLKCRVKVDGLERRDLNGRQGTLRHWDSKKKKFCVGLDTKKALDCDEFFFLPENVQAVGSSPRSGKDTTQQSYHVDMKNVLNQDDEGEGDVMCCRFTIDKSILGNINIIGAKSISDGLKSFSLAQDNHEKRVRLQMEKERKEEEYYRKQEEEGRKRRREKERAAREAKEREREKRRQKNDEERKWNSIQNKLMEKMREEFDRLEERQRQQWKRQKFKEEIFERFVGSGYIDEEEFNEYLEENDYDNAMDEDPNGFINKMYQWFESKTGQKFQDQ